MKLRDVLLEGRRETLLAKYHPRLLAFAKEDWLIPSDVWGKLGTLPGKDKGEQMFSHIASFDPDANNGFTEWLVRNILSQQMKLEDLEAAKRSLELYAIVKPRMAPDARDLGKYRSLGALNQALAPYRQISKRQKDKLMAQRMAEQAKIVMDTAEWRIVIPQSMAASCHYGINTEWCTANSDPDANMFERYSRNSPFFILLNKPTNKRWGFAPGELEFVDENNRPVDFNEFLAEHPELQDVMGHWSKIMQVPTSWDRFTEGYLTAALWTGRDDDDVPLDHNYTTRNFDPRALIKSIRECRVFQDHNRRLLNRAYEQNYDEGMAGHDFWLSRSDSGAGFSNRVQLTKGGIGTALDRAAEDFPNIEVMVDHGRIYFY